MIRLIRENSLNLTQKQINQFFYKNKLRCFKNMGDKQVVYSQRALDSHIEDLEECYKWLNSLEFPLTIFRGVRVASKDAIRQPYGISWTPTTDIFIGNNTIGAKNFNYFIVTTIDNASSIDLSTTIDNFVYYSAKPQYNTTPEYEITLKSRAKLSNVEILSRDEFLNKYRR